MELSDNYYGNLKVYDEFHHKLQETIQKDMAKWEKMDTSHSPIEKELISRIRMLPELYLLALKLLRDESNPSQGKGALYIGLMYVAAPVDLISDHISIYGWMDDLVVVAMALDRYFSQNRSRTQEVINTHWKHSKDLRALLFMIISIFNQVAKDLPPSMVGIIRDMFYVELMPETNDYI